MDHNKSYRMTPATKKKSGGNSEMDQKLKKLAGFAVAVFLAFASVWIFSGERGAWQGVPFILIAPAIANIFFADRRVIYALFALCGFTVSAFDYASISYSIKYTLVVLAIAFLSVLVKRLVVTGFRIRMVKGLLCLAVALCITVAAFVVYTVYNGTYFGSISAAKENKAAFEEKYRDTEIVFTSGNTYYSKAAGGYLTEFDFSHGEPVTALYSKNARDGEVDGYHNYCAALMMQEKADDLAYILSYHYSRDYDFAVRYADFVGKVQLLPWSDEDNFDHMMNFEIAFEERFDSREAFAERCLEYYDIIEESDFEYNGITFLGVNGYTYQLTVPMDKKELVTAENVVDFDRKSFKVYKNEDDVKNFWK